MEGEAALGPAAVPIEVVDNRSARLAVGTACRASLLAAQAQAQAQSGADSSSTSSSSHPVSAQQRAEGMARLLMAMCVLPADLLLPVAVCDILWHHALQPSDPPPPPVHTLSATKCSKLQSRQLLAGLIGRGLVGGSMHAVRMVVSAWHGAWILLVAAL
jgi:hypothetical protein